MGGIRWTKCLARPLRSLRQSAFCRVKGLGIIRTMRGSLEPVTRNVLVEKHDRQGDE